MRINVMIAASLWLLCGISASTSATELYPDNNNWYLFDVDTLVSQSGGTEWIDAQQDEPLGYIGDGSPLTFSFSLARYSFLNVVDAGISGDVFSLLINGEHYTTSAAAADSGVFAGADFDLAWSTAAFSRLSLLLAPGDYTVTGFLNQSAVDEFGSPYLTTLGGLKIVEADEPGLWLLLGVGMLTVTLRRRSQYGVTKLCDKGVLV